MKPAIRAVLVELLSDRGRSTSADEPARYALSAAEVGRLLRMSDQHVRDMAGWLAEHGAPLLTIDGRKYFRGTDIAALVDGEGAPPPTSEPLVYTVDEAAAVLGLTPRAVRTAIDLGQLPGVLRVGRTVRLSRRQLARSPDR